MIRAWISDTKSGDQERVNVDEEELEILKWWGEPGISMIYKNNIIAALNWLLVASWIIIIIHD